MQSCHRYALALVTGLLVVGGATDALRTSPRAGADEFNFDNGGGDNLWSTPENWRNWTRNSQGDENDQLPDIDDRANIGKLVIIEATDNFQVSGTRVGTSPGSDGGNGVLDIFGSLTVANNGTGSGNFLVADSSSASDRDGTVNLYTGGTLYVQGGLTVGQATKSGGTHQAAFNLLGGTLTVDGLTTIGRNDIAVFNVDSGTANLSNGLQFGGGSNQVSATLNINGGTVNVTQITTGSGNADFGTINYDGGTLNVTGHNITVDRLNVGIDNAVGYTQGGGTVTLGRGLTLGRNAGSSGSYTVDGGGTFISDGGVAGGEGGSSFATTSNANLILGLAGGISADNITFGSDTTLDFSVTSDVRVQTTFNGGTGDWDTDADWSNGRAESFTITSGSTITVIDAANSLVGKGNLVLADTDNFAFDAGAPANQVRVQWINSDGAPDIVTGPTLAVINDGTVTRTGDLLLADQTSGVQATRIRQAGGTLNVTGELTLGDTEIGRYRLNGGALNAGSIMIGGNNAATGLGIFTQNDGDVVTTGDLQIGSDSGGLGTYTMAAGTAQVGGDLIVGSAGDGVLEITGGTFNANNVQIADAAAGTIDIRGGSLQVAGNITHGAGSGVSTINVDVLDGLQLTGPGATALLNNLNIGNAAGSTGSFTLESGQKLTIEGADGGSSGSGSLSIGVNGTGTFTVVSGTDNGAGQTIIDSSKGLQLANGDAAGVGHLIIGTVGDANDLIEIKLRGGNLETADVGTGNITFNSGTINQETNNIIVGQGDDSHATFTMNGGIINIATGQLRIANRGTSEFFQNDGEVHVAGTLDMGNQNGADAPGQGTYTMNGGTLDAANNILGNANGGASGTFIMNDGAAAGVPVVTINGTTSLAAAADATGTFTMNAGQYDNGGIFRIGDAGLGVASINGGTLNITGDLQLGQSANGTGVLNVDGGTVSVGGIVSTGGGSSTINLSSGSFGFDAGSTGDLTVDQFNVGVTSSFAYTQTKGTATIGQLQLGADGNSGTYNVDGGLLVLGSGVAPGAASGGSVLNVGTDGSAGGLQVSGLNPSFSSYERIDAYNQGSDGTLTLSLNAFGTSVMLATDASFGAGSVVDIDLSQRVDGASTSAESSWIGGEGDWDDNQAWSNGSPGGWVITGALGSGASEITFLNSTNAYTDGGLILGATATGAGWTLDLSDPNNARLVNNGDDIISGPVLARIDDATAVVNRTSGDLRVAVEAGADAAQIVVNDGVLNIGSVGTPLNLIQGGGSQGSVVQTGGEVNIFGDLQFGVTGASGDNGGTYSLNGGVLRVHGDINELTSAVNSAQFYISGGTLEMVNGGDITTQSFRVAQNNNSTASFTLTTGLLTNTGSFFVASGSNSDGTFTLDGGAMNLRTIEVGDNAGAVGRFIVKSGTLDQVSGTFALGDFGNGTFDVSGGTVSLSTVSIADEVDSVGQMIISGGDVSASSNFQIGDDGTGQIDLSGGTLTLTGGNTNLGTNETASGTVNITGGVAEITSNNFRVGHAGGGVLNVTGGTGHTLGGSMIVGVSDTATSIGEVTINLANAGDTAAVNSDVTVGAGGRGTLNVLNGTFTVNDALTLATSATSDEADGDSTEDRIARVVIGDGTTDPTLNVGVNSGNFDIANVGTGIVVQNSGTVNVINGNLVVTQGADSNGSYTIHNGLLDLTNDMNFNSGVGTFVQNGGTVIVRDDINFGQADATASYTLNGGELQFVDMLGRGGTNTFTWNGGTIRNVAGSNLDNSNMTIDVNGAASHTFTVDSGQTATFNGNANFSGDGALTKNGDGTLVLGSNNTHTGGTTVDAGVLEVNGSLNGTTIVNSDATLSGIGTVGDITLNSGSTLSPGNSPGEMTAASATFEGDSAFHFEMTDAAGVAGVDWDLLTVSGTLTINSTAAAPVTIDFDSLASATNSSGAMDNFDPLQSYFEVWAFATAGVIELTGGDPLEDLFVFDTSGLATYFPQASGGQFYVSMSGGGDTLYVNYTAVPEPGSMALAAITALGLFGYGWRRRRKRIAKEDDVVTSA